MKITADARSRGTVRAGGSLAPLPVGVALRLRPRAQRSGQATGVPLAARGQGLRQRAHAPTPDCFCE